MDVVFGRIQANLKRLLREQQFGFKLDKIGYDLIDLVI